jgi:hypothetical protein
MRRTLSKWFVVVLIPPFIAGCGARPSEASRTADYSPTRTVASIPTPRTETIAQATSSATADRYGFPTQIDPTDRYIIYLHGKVIEDQGLPAISPDYGEYQYEKILAALESYGFKVISEQRSKDADGWEYAQRGASQIDELLKAGVPPSSITVVGASKGASIAVGVSYLVANPDVNYVLLGTCHPSSINEWTQEGVTLSGNVLAIRDIADIQYSGSCEELFDVSEGNGLNRTGELVLQVGTGHGILFQPLPEWVLPTVQWANQEW